MSSSMWHPILKHGDSGHQFHLDQNFGNDSVDLRIAKSSGDMRYIGILDFVEAVPMDVPEPTLQVPSNGGYFATSFQRFVGVWVPPTRTSP